MNLDWDSAIAVGSYLRDFVRDYQTLIAGIMAIVAAVIAVKPVWRQLQQMGTQTNLNYREFLHDRVRITASRQRWFADRLRKFGSDVVSRLSDMERDTGTVNVRWAFEQDQIAGQLLAEVKDRQVDQRDPPDIESALHDAVARLESLGNKFEAIHRPHSSNQSDEDYAISDDDWAKLQEDGRQAEISVRDAITEFTNTVGRVDDAFTAELSSLRDRIRKVDQLLARYQVGDGTTS